MSFLTNYYSSINQSPPKFAQISNDIQKTITLEDLTNPDKK